VALEEVLHLALAANILNAIGGSPVLDSPRLMQAHPTWRIGGRLIRLPTRIDDSVDGLS
jgi:Ferritin-like